MKKKPYYFIPLFTLGASLFSCGGGNQVKTFNVTCKCNLKESKMGLEKEIIIEGEKLLKQYSSKLF